MAHFSLRKPLALAAVLATSVGAVLATSTTAQATAAGALGSPLTIVANGAITVVGGGRVALPAGAHDVSWAGQGGRFAFVGADDGIYTADYNGGSVIKIAQGTNPSHTVWSLAGDTVYWTEGTGATARLVGTAADGDALTWQTRTWDALQNPAAKTGVSNLDVAGDDRTTMVYQKNDGTGGAGSDTVTVAYYDAQGTQLTRPIAAGTNPTISADAKLVVFVRPDADGVKQLWGAAYDAATDAWSAAQQLTVGGQDKTGPVFEAGADWRKVAYETAGATYRIDLGAGLPGLPGAGVTGVAETKVSDLSGALAVRTDNPAYIHRLGGATRFETATKVSQQLFRDAGAATDGRAQAQAVVLTRSDQFADALGGSALAAHKNAPLLLTETAALNDLTRAEIQRVLPAGGTVYVLGGEQAVSPNVANQLGRLGYRVQRIGGYDRFETAVNMANVYAPKATTVLAATGTNFPDALSAGAVAASFNDTAVVLTDDRALPAVTRAYIGSRIDDSTLKYLGAVGGQADAALNTAFQGYERLGGPTRYETSYNVAKSLFQGGFYAVGVATGANWPDSLSGGALMGRAFGPLLLVDPAVGLSAPESALLDANRGAANWGYVFGGPVALSSHVDDQLAAAIDTAAGSVHDQGRGSTPQVSTPNLAVK